ncbi:hypothetical protein NDU88_006776 [Pleurodeles waltl]|uniref:Uncharacterized protein n=1 Tax=Pleurodeles waltl TaxID=8319 RepID=A0AAV7PJC9_PLEWA|nr:hypothetical protein NDU88_006776 [Pleurodeles waltl]
MWCPLVFRDAAIRGLYVTIPVLCLHHTRSAARPPHLLSASSWGSSADRGVLQACAPPHKLQRSRALQAEVIRGPHLYMSTASGAGYAAFTKRVGLPGVSSAVLIWEPTDVVGSTLMPPFLLASDDHLGPPRGLNMMDVCRSQAERSAQASAIFTSQATSPYTHSLNF